MLDLVLASVCVCVLVCVGVSSAHFEHFHFQCSQPASHREVPFQRLKVANSHQQKGTTTILGVLQFLKKIRKRLQQNCKTNDSTDQE